jgi:hypothetical protein
MEPECSLPHSQEPATCPYPEPEQSRVNATPPPRPPSHKYVYTQHDNETSHFPAFNDFTQETKIKQVFLDSDGFNFGALFIAEMWQCVQRNSSSAANGHSARKKYARHFMVSKYLLANLQKPCHRFLSRIKRIRSKISNVFS